MRGGGSGIEITPRRIRSDGIWGTAGLVATEHGGTERSNLKPGRRAGLGAS